jgi:alpha-galactosidase
MIEKTGSISDEGTEEVPSRSVKKTKQKIRKLIAVCQGFCVELDKIEKQGVKKITLSKYQELWKKCGGDVSE